MNGLDGVVTKSFEAVGISSSTDSFTISDGDNLPADVGGVTANVTIVVAVVQWGESFSFNFCSEFGTFSEFSMQFRTLPVIHSYDLKTCTGASHMIFIFVYIIDFKRI